MQPFKFGHNKQLLLLSTFFPAIFKLRCHKVITTVECDKIYKIDMDGVY